MRKIQQVSFSLTSVLIAAALVSIDSQVAMACSGSSSSSGLSHGSRLGAGSVTVCVGSSSSSAGSSTTQTITKTITVPVPPKPKPAPKPAPKPVAKPVSNISPKPVATPISCPSASQMASMPQSADAAERWVQSICSPSPRVVSDPISLPKSAPKPVVKTKTVTITETITVDVPGESYSAAEAVEFHPNPLVASVFPAKLLSRGQLATFSSNPSSHFGSAIVLGHQAEVHFIPVYSEWIFSDGGVQAGVDTQRAFKTSGKYQIRAIVEYSVSYRLLGEGAWQRVEGSLQIESNPLEVTVGAFGFKADQSSQGVLLVGADCRGRAGAFGCDI